MSAVKVISAALLAASGAVQATEEPAYAVVQKNEVFEVRRYEPYVVAEVVVPGPASEAGNQGFGILAGYIFGKNRGERKLEMTAPVAQTPVAAEPVKLDMTAPVAQQATTGGFLLQFVMPRGYTLATLPEPLDARIKLRDVPAQTVGVIRYSGGWSQASYDENLAKLRQALAAANLKTEGEPIFSRYNSPMMPAFWRRNEIWLTLI
jgi:SOUL heme-binding protein